MAWTNNPVNFIKEIEKDLCDRQKKIAIDALRGVIEASPVDSGAFKGNHRLSINTEDHGFDPNISDKAGSSALSKGLSVLAQLVPYSTVYIQNNAPYGPTLEYGGYSNPVKKGSWVKGKGFVIKSADGYSKQAPLGIYGVTFTLIKEKYK
ncbi:hypothetical protein B9T31_12130 [Acinetobacter sp. ANC 4558]|uniref:hypothetical protein n=1 Tax=Acinetobacter sp. ANC 4558 TaxID=1977876 RepID=UPI000A34AC76|nr:hypothetical protein [Acinetobacter sp. ANC 4558]OTG85532.1 hypothetical protein B9T31_12130 [Acinetobacter sp. ANC 4558]